MSNPTQITDKILALSVPIDAIDFRLKQNKYKNVFICFKDEMIMVSTSVNFKILGTVDLESISFDCSGYVKSFNSDLGKVYDSYTNKDKFWTCPKLSFRSLLKSKGIETTSESKILIIEKV